MSQVARPHPKGSWEEFVDHLQDAPGRLPVGIRRKIFEQTRTGRHDDSALGTFCTLIAERSYRVTAQEIAELVHVGYSEDEIFEAIVLAAVGAAQRRVDTARTAIGVS